MDAKATTDGFSDERYDGWIGIISPAAFTPKAVETVEMRTKRVYPASVFGQNPEGELRLGMPAIVTLPLNQPEK